jgi:hypothetical protein
MKTIIYIIVLLIIVSCSISVAYINKPQDEAWQIMGTNSDTTTSRIVGKTIDNVKKASAKEAKAIININQDEDTIN